MMEWGKVFLPSLAAILVPFIAFLAPRLWPESHRRVQSEAEARLKRLEAVEKALTLTTKIRTELDIDINTHDLLGNFHRIAREFADPAVLSREALEEWERRRWWPRLLLALFDPPNFTVPANRARYARRLLVDMVILVALGGLWWFAFDKFGNHELMAWWPYDPSWTGPVGFLYCVVLANARIPAAYWNLRSALKHLRCMSETSIIRFRTNAPTAIDSDTLV